MPNYGSSNLKVSDAITVAQVGGVIDAYPTHFAFLGKGGWRSAASLSTLNTTSSLRLEEGCAGYVWSDPTAANNGLYVYTSGAWVKTSLSPTAYSLPIASASVLGGVRIPSGGPISINSGNGDLSLRIASANDTGIVRVGNGLAIDGSGILSVTAANLTVKNEDGNYSESSPTLRFKGTGDIGIAKISNENVVTINAPTATVGGTAGQFTNIVFAASGGMSVGGSYNLGTKTYTVTYSVTSTGTLKQNLHELDDVNSCTVLAPTNGQILQYTSSKWNAVDYTPGIGLTSLKANPPILYNNTTGEFSMNVATTNQNGYLTASNWNMFNNKQDALTITTLGTSGAATLVGSTLNIPQYSGGGGGGTVTNVAVTIDSSGTDISSNVADPDGNVEITLSIPTASSSNRGVITSGQFNTFNSVTNKLNITAGTNAGSGTSITLDFSVTDTIYGSVASGSAVTGNINVSTASGKVGVTHIVVHNSSTIPNIAGLSGTSVLKLSGSGNYKPSVNNFIYFTYISGTTVIYSINQAS